MAGRPLAVGAAGGGIVSILSQIVLDHLKEPYPFLPDPRDRDFLSERPLEVAGFEVHWSSLLLGILIGLSIGPVAELLLELRSLWSAWIRRQLLALLRPSFGTGRALYRDL